MPRDRTPILIAATTAIASCALLALSIWFGWLGPDVGRGANFCEAPNGWTVRQPANTFSNAGFVVAGLLIAWHAGVPGEAGKGLAAHRYLATFMACLVVLLGPGSAAMHATQSTVGGHLDMSSMYLVASFAVAYAAMRWLRGNVRLFGAAFVAALAFCELVGLWRGELAVVMHSGNAAFAFLLVAAITIEVLIIRRREVRARIPYALTSLASMLAAFVIWNVGKVWLCDPHSLIQGHAAWHILCAVSVYFLYRYYAGEEVADGPRQGRSSLEDPRRKPGAGPVARVGSGPRRSWRRWRVAAAVTPAEEET
ncbi:ceramidase domain-containing protein [Catellatospora vulcania]|uniref:ceramidase domain-containing protein n=1 Tax=Catellatospora vulcania TaxID=1460450 RepID=UPI0018AFC345|nr:ceramidase domain-containing protein [Catellatospora vulcania]